MMKYKIVERNRGNLTYYLIFIQRKRFFFFNYWDLLYDDPLFGDELSSFDTLEDAEAHIHYLATKRKRTGEVIDKVVQAGSFKIF